MKERAGLGFLTSILKIIVFGEWIFNILRRTPLTVNRTQIVQ